MELNFAMVARDGLSSTWGAEKINLFSFELNFSAAAAWAGPRRKWDAEKIKFFFFGI